MPIHFATSAVTVSQLFSGSHTYRMPEFQRPYSWPDDRAVQLFDDLESACVASASRASSATEYFLGALIVTQQSPRAPFLIVDGQQRLVTLAAILAILRDHLRQGDFRARLHERIERPTDQAADYQKAPRIELRRIDQDEFVRWVIKDGGTVRLPRISETRSTAKLLDALNQLNQNFPNANEEFIRRLATFILNNCSFVQISANSIDDAYKLFKSVNNPGLSLERSGARANRTARALRPRSRLSAPRSPAPGTRSRSRAAMTSFASTSSRSPHSYCLGPLTASSFPSCARFPGTAASRANSTASSATSCSPIARSIPPRSISDRTPPASTGISTACSTPPSTTGGPRHCFWLTQGRAPPDSLAFFRALDGLCLALQILSIKAKAITRRFERLLDAIEANTALSRTTSPLYLTETEARSVRERITGPRRTSSVT